MLKFRLPDIGEGVAEGEIVRWLVAEGETLTEDQPLCEVMTDKVTVEVPAPQGGRLAKRVHPEGAIVAVGAELAWIDSAEASPEAISSPPAPSFNEANSPDPRTTAMPANTQASLSAALSPPASVPCSTPRHILAAPATRKLARTLGVSLDMVTGSGPHGRVTPQDVHTAAQQEVICLHEQPARNEAPPTPLLLQEPTAAIADQVKPYTGLRRTIGERLSTAKRTIPEFVLVEEVNVTRLVALRSEIKHAAHGRGVKLTYLPFILKALGPALRQFPALNAQLIDNEIIHKGGIHLGIAVDIPDGLMVPVIRHADRLTVLQLAAGVEHLSHKARSGKLTREEASGSTLTVTSIGSIGGILGIPIINPPEAAILAVNRIRKAPVVNGEDQIVVGSVMNLTLTCDHRVVDGATAARFLTHLREQLEAPASLLL